MLLHCQSTLNSLPTINTVLSFSVLKHVHSLAMCDITMDVDFSCLPQSHELIPVAVLSFILPNVQNCAVSFMQFFSLLAQYPG